MTETNPKPIVTSLVSDDHEAPDPKQVQSWVAAYFSGTQSMNADQWYSAFATDAIVDDPVGTPIKRTPDQIRAMGTGFLEPFDKIGLYESFVHVVGNEAVARWQGRGVTKDGQEVKFDGINLFTFNNDGKITELRGFFSPPGS
ncbi:MAG: nuclear transport factor 2 family protein [Erythrobacter sp.]